MFRCKKLLALMLSGSLMLNFVYYKKTKAVEPMTACLLVTTGITAAGFIWGLIKEGAIIKLNHYEVLKIQEEVAKYKGFRTRADATRLIKDVMSGASETRVYGQERAKMQCRAALAGCLENIYGSLSEKRGNVVYMIGGSGVGKTTMARALANAFLKHSDHACIFIDSSQIDSEQPLGEQLFKTIVQTVNLKKEKNWRNLWGSLDIEAARSAGAYDIRIASPMLQHILNYVEVVVIIDEYDKMKLICRPTDAPEDYEDKSGDEILKTIADRGEYDVGNNKIDCQKILFLVTTNETKEQLYESFGHRGSTGGGVQRLNVIEFGSLDKECCRKIINDMVTNIKKNLTNPSGGHKIKRVDFSKTTLENMADYIFKNKTKQARAKIDLEQNIYALFSFELHENVGKSFEVQYAPPESEAEDISELLGTFSAKELVNKPVIKGSITSGCDDANEEFFKMFKM